MLHLRWSAGQRYLRGVTSPTEPKPKSAAPRGAADRVARAHSQARPALALALAFALAAPVAAVVPHDTGAWLPLHLFLVGALLCAISGTTQMLAVTWSTSPAPDRRLATAQRAAVAAGAVAVAMGRELEVDALTIAGGASLVVGLGLLAALLLGVRRGAVTDRYYPAIEAYVGAVAFGLVGMTMGVVLSVARPSGWSSELRAAHLTVNLFGLVGLVIAGTLPFFTATQARMKMLPGATPARLRATFAALAGAVVVAAGGHAASSPAVAALGLAAYAAGLGAIVALLPRLGRRQLDWAGARLVQLLAGVLWWAGTTLVLAVQVLTERGDQDRTLRALVVGGFAQILLASLAYLGPVLRGGGHQSLTAGFTTTRSWVGLVAANVAAVGLLAGANGVVGASLAVWALDAAGRGVRLLRPGASAALDADAAR